VAPFPRRCHFGQLDMDNMSKAQPAEAIRNKDGGLLFKRVAMWLKDPPFLQPIVLIDPPSFGYVNRPHDNTIHNTPIASTAQKSTLSGETDRRAASHAPEVLSEPHLLLLMRRRCLYLAAAPAYEIHKMH